MAEVSRWSRNVPNFTEIDINRFKHLYELLKDNGWCTGALAKDNSGKPVSVLGDNACRFCLAGLAHRFGRVNAISQMRPAEYLTSIFKGCSVIGEYNDSFRSKRDLMKNMRSIIRKAEKELAKNEAKAS